jgi:predicted negative regulator of RcsB-dependent stress response
MSYHDEQESIESLKAWWARWGNLTTWILLVVMVAAAAWNGWNYWQRRQAAQAAGLYEAAQQAITGGDKTQIARAAGDMENQYGSTPYAPMTALAAAKALYTAGDAAGAKTQLQWTIDHAKDDGYREIARLRLAQLLLDEKAYDAGLALLDGTPPEGFKGLVADRRGDLLTAQGKTSDARTAYQLAIASLPPQDNQLRVLVEFKLAALGN